MFSGGGGAWLAFTRGEHRYVVYTAIGQGWGDKAGVVVERGGRRLAALACTRPPVSDIGPELFERAGIRHAGRRFRAALSPLLEGTRHLVDGRRGRQA
jgi:hypothetical protein